MTVLAATDKIVPRSALRYRPFQTPPPQVSIPPVVARASRRRTESASRSEGQGDEETPVSTVPKAPSKASRSTTPSTTITAPPVPAMPVSHARRIHPLLSLGIGMLAMLALWTGLSFVITWARITVDDVEYGRPRTYQIDAFVGHNEQSGIPSHFIAINLNRHLQIIEFPGGDPSHAKIYSGPVLYGESDALVPVTLSFADVNGDHKPDMIVHVQDSRLVFINEGASFRPMQPAERPMVEQYLQHHPDV